MEISANRLRCLGFLLLALATTSGHAYANQHPSDDQDTPTYQTSTESGGDTSSSGTGTPSASPEKTDLKKNPNLTNDFLKNNGLDKEKVEKALEAFAKTPTIETVISGFADAKDKDASAALARFADFLKDEGTAEHAETLKTLREQLLAKSIGAGPELTSEEKAPELTSEEKALVANLDRMDPQAFAAAFMKTTGESERKTRLLNAALATVPPGRRTALREATTRALQIRQFTEGLDRLNARAAPTKEAYSKFLKADGDHVASLRELVSSKSISLETPKATLLSTLGITPDSPQAKAIDLAQAAHSSSRFQLQKDVRAIRERGGPVNAEEKAKVLELDAELAPQFAGYADAVRATGESGDAEFGRFARLRDAGKVLADPKATADEKKAAIEQFARQGYQTFHAVGPGKRAALRASLEALSKNPATDDANRAMAGELLRWFDYAGRRTAGQGHDAALAALAKDDTNADLRKGAADAAWATEKGRLAELDQFRRAFRLTRDPTTGGSYYEVIPGQEKFVAKMLQSYPGLATFGARNGDALYFSAAQYRVDGSGNLVAPPPGGFFDVALNQSLFNPGAGKLGGNALSGPAMLRVGRDREALNGFFKALRESEDSFKLQDNWNLGTAVAAHNRVTVPSVNFDLGSGFSAGGNIVLPGAPKTGISLKNNELTTYRPLTSPAVEIDPKRLPKLLARQVDPMPVPPEGSKDVNVYMIFGRGPQMIKEGPKKGQMDEGDTAAIAHEEVARKRDPSAIIVRLRNEQVEVGNDGKINFEKLNDFVKAQVGGKSVAGVMIVGHGNTNAKDLKGKSGQLIDSSFFVANGGGDSSLRGDPGTPLDQPKKSSRPPLDLTNLGDERTQSVLAKGGFGVGGGAFRENLNSLGDLVKNLGAQRCTLFSCYAGAGTGRAEAEETIGSVLANRSGVPVMSFTDIVTVGNASHPQYHILDRTALGWRPRVVWQQPNLWRSPR